MAMGGPQMQPHGGMQGGYVAPNMHGGYGVPVQGYGGGGGGGLRR